MRTAPADNIFGKILAGEIPSTEVYSDEKVYCFLDLYPQNPGHTLVVPRNYSENLHAAEVDEVTACMLAVKKLIPAIIAATGAKGVTVMANMGREAGQMIEYLHFHVIPRHPGDDVSLYKLGEEQTAADLNAMADKIRGNI